MEENKLGLYLKELRKKHKLSQKEVASKLNISRQACSHYETGRINPPLESLIAIAKLYQVSLEEVLSHKKSSALSKKTSETKHSKKKPSHASKFSTPSFLYDPHTISEEIKLIHAFRQLTSEQKNEILHFIEYISKHEPKS